MIRTGSFLWVEVEIIFIYVLKFNPAFPGAFKSLIEIKCHAKRTLEQ